MAVALGTDFSLVLVENGSIVVFGRNNHGQLGLGHRMYVTIPGILSRRSVFGGEQIIMVAAGNFHAACVSTAGFLWMWGSNWHGELGADASTQNFLVPVRVPKNRFRNENVVMVALGSHFTIVLTEEGHVWSSGRNQSGQLGHGHQDTIETFTQIDPACFRNRPIGMIAVGDSHSMAMAREVGTMVWTWGNNDFSQLGHGNYAVHTEDMCCTPTRLPPTSFGGVAVAAMAASDRYSAVVTVDGMLWVCGTHDFNCEVMRRYGQPEEFGGSGVRQISCGKHNVLVVTNNNTLYTVIPTRFDGNAHHNGSITRENSKSVFHGEGVHVVASGCTHSAVLTPRGKLYTCGNQDVYCERLQQMFCVGAQIQVGGHGEPIKLNLPTSEKLRFGRWHMPGLAHRIAFAMGLDAHLATGDAGTAYSNMDFPGDLCTAIFICTRIRSRPGTSRGFQDMLGRDVI